MKAICTPNHYIKLFGKVLLFACILLFSGRVGATIRYVMVGASGSGTSWSNASGDLQAMINASSSGDQVWVSAGNYYASSGQSFSMKAGVQIYGGFAGSETGPGQRNLSTYSSYLYSTTGTTMVNFNNGLTATALLDGFSFTGATNTAVLNASSSPAFANCTFSSNSNSDPSGGGGAMYNASASPTLTNCLFQNNTAANTGGAICNASTCYLTLTNCTFKNNSAIDGGGLYNNYPSSAVLTNCTFTSNSANNDAGGGAIYNEFSLSLVNCTFTGNNANNSYGGGIFNVSNGFNTSLTATNCTFTGNRASGGSGAAIANFNSSSIQLTNCTVAGNSAAAGAILNIGGSLVIRNTIIYRNNSGIFNSGGSVTINYSLVQGFTDITNGNISGTIDPLFVNPLSPGQNTGGDYSLQPCSPVINKGSNGYYASGQSPDLSSITTDVAGNARFYNNGLVDMGAYERQATTVVPATAGIIYVKAGGVGTGASWSCATGDLQAAINAAVSGNQIWVAGGTYTPNRRSDATATIATGDRNDAFVLKSGVKIYGGFAGTETSLSNRNLALTANASILSGDLNSNDNGFTNNGDNAYHVVVSTGDVSTAELNGFTIQGGNCDAGGGGGIYCSNSSPTLNHLIIKGNAGRYGAGLCFSSSSPAISNSIIYGNAGFYGGGIIASNSGANLTNVLISGNTAVEQGGGMYNEFAVAPTLTNVTITGNTANYNSGAMYNNLGPSLNISNSIIYGNNTGINNNNGTPSIQYSLVQGETSTANGNISGTTDPLFVSQQAAGLSAGGDYRLQSCSPAINAGNSTLYNSSETTDLAAASRIQGTSVDMGGYEFAGSYSGNPGAIDLLAINGDAGNVASVSGSTTFTASTSTCRLISTVLPNGSSPVYGNVTAKAWIESTQPSNYVKRHYEITGLNTVSGTTGKVTLYFTQADFDAFNAVNVLKLPASATDAAGKANLVIEKYYGSSTDGSGLPASYNNSSVIIDPANANIVWNSTLGRWEVSFDVTGFGGFFVKTQAVVLPLTLVSFTGSRYNEYNQLQWKTADEVNTGNFVLERSADGSSYTAITTIAANGVGNGTYSYKDYTTFTGKIYYRLKMMDVDGHYTYSTIATLINNGRNAVSIYPNPASDVVYINAGTGLLYSQAGLYDANGRLLQTILITTAPQAINVQQLTKGLYVLKFANGATEKFIKK